MSNCNSLIELAILEKEDLNKSLGIFNPSLDLSDISIIPKKPLHHFLCKKCNTIPVIQFLLKNKIKYLCKCEELPKKLLIKDIFTLLYSESDEKLKCYIHPEEKYSLYCKNCKKNLCQKCILDCNDHEDKVISLAKNYNTINQIKYIDKIIRNKTQNIIDDEKNYLTKLDIDDEGENGSVKNKHIKEKNIKNNNYEEDEPNEEKECFIQIKESIYNINNESKEELKNMINNYDKHESNEEEENYYINLFSIIINDYINYLNFYLIETISNIEQFVAFYFGDCNEINLQFEFNKEDIKNNSIEILGKNFVKNNKNNCFLIINDNIMELKRFIFLTDIYENYNIDINYPLKLNVKLLERKNNLMTNISYMFYEISTLMPISNLSDFDTTNIKDMSYMFYNCSSIIELPDISNWNTKNVNNMSYMFYNCSSLLIMPDISKWNTSNVENVSYMFYNCSSITHLPDISKWDTNNIKFLNNIFSYCESLTNLPDLSKLTTSKSLIEKEIFENNEVFEIDKKEKKCTLKKSLNYLKRLFDCSDICPSFKQFILYFILTFIVILIIFISLIPLQNSLLSDKTNEFFNISNYTNITYLAEYLNITDLITVKNMEENEEYLLNYIINITLIDDKNSFESDKRKSKIYGIILFILFISKLLILIFFCAFFCSFVEFFLKKCLVKTHICFDVISIVLGLLDINVIKRIKYFYSLLFDKIEKIFTNKMPKVIQDKFLMFDTSLTAIRINIFISIIFLIISITFSYLD